MKALEILKNPMAIISANENHVYSKKQIYQVIVELEEAMKPKTCAGCYYEPLHDFELPCKSCKRNSADFYKEDK